MGTPLIIDNEVKARLAEVRDYARAHRLDLAALKAWCERGTAFDDVEQRAASIPIGFRLVYSIEEQPEPCGWCHHISMSSGRPGRVMNPAACALLIAELGITFPGWTHCHVSFEEQSPYRPVNIIIPFTTQPADAAQ
jgi:hypothetical protein